MHRTRVLFAMVASLLTAGAVCAAQSALPVPASLRTHLQSEQFAIITSVRGLPLGVREEMQRMFRSTTLDIADPGAEYQSTDVLVRPGLPIRRMVAAGCSSDFHCLVYYQRGGIATQWSVMLFRWTPDETRFEFGGAAPGGLATVNDVRKAVLSGSLRDAGNSW